MDRINLGVLVAGSTDIVKNHDPEDPLDEDSIGVY